MIGCVGAFACAFPAVGCTGGAVVPGGLLSGALCLAAGGGCGGAAVRAGAAFALAASDVAGGAVGAGSAAGVAGGCVAVLCCWAGCFGCSELWFDLLWHPHTTNVAHRMIRLGNFFCIVLPPVMSRLDKNTPPDCAGGVAIVATLAARRAPTHHHAPV